MSLQPNVEEQQLLAETVDLSQQKPSRREWLAQLLVGAAFLATSSILAAVRPIDSFHPFSAAICVAVLALAALIRFETPLGFTAVTQLAFVPMLFALPVTLVPFAVIAGLLVAQLYEIAAGEAKASRLYVVISNARFSLGPVLVFVLAGRDPQQASAALAGLALLAQFVVDFGASSVEYRLARGISFRAQLRDGWIYAVDAALSPIALVVAHAAHGNVLAVLSPLPLLALLGLFAQERHHRLRSLLELNHAYRGTALVLGEVVEADDGYTATHCREVVDMALEVGRGLGLSGEDLRNLDFAALLHDVGKIAIPKEIINKPGPLDPEEYEIVKTHTVVGQRMLDRVGGFMRTVGVIVRAHHERWDGAGYPDGLRDEEIPLAARIIACCDAWNAMRSDRVYRRALPMEVAIEELRTNAGSQFDPRVVEILLSLVGAPARSAAREPEFSAPSPEPVASELQAVLVERVTVGEDRPAPAATLADAAASDPVNRLLEESWESRSQRASRRELVVEGVAAALFLVTAVALAAPAFATHRFDAGLAAGMVGLFALIGAVVRFPVGAGYLVPTYVVLVPMLLLLPPGAVPLLSALAMLLASLARWATKRAPAEQLLFSIPNAWYSVAPAGVLMLAGHQHGIALAGIYVAAFLAGCLLDLAVSTFREAFALSVTPDLQLRVVFNVWMVDGCIAPLGLLIALVARHHHAYLLMVFPFTLLLLLVQHDRSSRIERAQHRLQLVARERSRLQAAVGWLGDALAAKLDLEALTSIALHSSVDALDGDAGIITVDRAGRPTLRRLAGSPEGKPLLHELSAAASASGATLWQSQHDFYVIAIPLVMRDERHGVQGSLTVGRSGRPFSSDEVALMKRLSRHAREAIDEILSHEALREQAVTDALTGLGNRRKLLADLSEFLDGGSSASAVPLILMLFDLDGFKSYNDAFGHAAGDTLLSRLGAKLEATISGCGSAYRLGGDEFCAVVRARAEEVHDLLARVTEALHEQGQDFSVDASCGAVLIPHEADTAEQALQLADERMYSHKEGRPSGLRSQTREVLMRVMQAREPSLPQHGSCVSVLAAAVGSRLGVGGHQQDELVRAAELHDIGKVAIPDAILGKTGDLDPAEWEYVRQYTVFGERILNVAPALRPIAKIVRATRERWDGGGYPDSLAGDQIPLAARIIAVCDAYDAMISERPYRKAKTAKAARKELLRQAGGQFDPVVVAALLDELDRVPSEPAAQSDGTEVAPERPHAHQIADQLLQVLTGSADGQAPADAAP